MSAAAGDEIYFHHNGTPKSGKVLCAGKHGCTVDHKGEQHRLKWEHIAGVKKRAERRYTVLEEGQDGLIVQDQTGAKRYIGIPNEAREEQLTVGTKNRPT